GAGEDGLAQQRPGIPAVGTLQDALAALRVGRPVRLARPGIDDLAGRVDCKRPDGQGWLAVGQGRPGGPAVATPPDPTTGRAGVDDGVIDRIDAKAGDAPGGPSVTSANGVVGG